jgi:hypothetical protein
MRRGVKAGLQTRAVRLVPTLEGIAFDAEVPVDVSGSDVEQTRAWSARYDETSGWVRKDGKVAGRSI